jgi:hypothetical protein
MNVTVEGVWLSAGIMLFWWIEIYEGLLLLCFASAKCSMYVASQA